MVKKNKKGQLGSLQEVVLTLVIVGLLIGVAFLVLGELRGTLSTTTNTVLNESVSPTDAGVYLAYNSSTSGVNCYNNALVVFVNNQSGNVPISSGNYSLNPYTGLFRNLTASANDDYNRAWNVSYTYDSGDDACQGVADTIDATKTIPTFLPIIVILLVVGVLLAIVFGVLIPKGKSKTAYV